MRRTSLLFLPLLAFFLSDILLAQTLSEKEAATSRVVDSKSPTALALLEKLVNLNSGTFNLDRVREVDNVLERGFQSHGFRTRWALMDQEDS
jgi:glutamate carboxypeptidase